VEGVGDGDGVDADGVSSGRRGRSGQRRRRRRQSGAAGDGVRHCGRGFAHVC
jgi:hypothetical protein